MRSTITLVLSLAALPSAALAQPLASRVALEWQLPLSARDWQVSLFVDGRASTIELAGLRVAWGMGAPLRDQARRMGWRRVR